MKDAILEIVDLEVRYAGHILGAGPVSLEVFGNEILGLVGESGSGKTTLSTAVLGSLPASAKITRGSIRFAGRDLVTTERSAWRAIRWRQLAYVPQGAMNSLNPVSRIRRQFADIVHDHMGAALEGKWLADVKNSLEAVRLGPEVLALYPHELSGGMKQRVCIAMAILFGPKLIIADEITSALDVVSQRVVLQTLLRVREQSGTSIILIGHDLALQAQVADRIGIMFSGHLVETGSSEDIFFDARHPYTRQLIAAVPSIRQRKGFADTVVSTEADRERWRREQAPLAEVKPGHFVQPVEGAAA